MSKIDDLRVLYESSLIAREDESGANDDGASWSLFFIALL